MTGPIPAAAPRPFGRSLILAGFATIVGFSGALAGWVALAPIESAVIATGVVSVDSNIKTLQHLEGGILEAILVRDGDYVRAGDVLFRLENTVPVAVMNELQAELFEARATEARLVAERDGAAQIRFPAALLEKVGDAAAQDAIRGQRSVFESRRTLMHERARILGRSIDGLEAEIRGFQGQIQSSLTQAALLDEELKDVRSLYERSLASRPRVLTLERRRAELDGDVSEFEAQIAAARRRIEETRLRITELRAEAAAEIDESLRRVRARAYEVQQKLSRARDVLRRTDIRAPIDGVAVAVRVHTLGGVIAAGEPLVDIVPSDDDLVVIAAIDPLDIDQVRVGQAATVRLAAANRRTQTPLHGELRTVSADVIEAPGVAGGHFVGRIALEADAEALSLASVKPGMRAEVMLRTGSRTPWEYIAAPIARTLGRSLREE